MKKLSLIFLLSFLFSSLLEASSSVFVGVDGGYSIDRIDTEKWFDTPIKAPYVKNAYRGNGGFLNVNAGFEHYLQQNDRLGFRWIAQLGYGKTNFIDQKNTSVQYPSSTFEGGFAFDALFDTIKQSSTLTLFVGGEVGAMGSFSDAKCDDFFANPKLSALNAYGSARFGASVLLAKKHRIELGIKFPLYTIKPGDNTYKPIRIMLGYKFLFDSFH